MSGITVNCIAPGVIDSPMNNAHLSEEEMKELIEQTPLGRLGTAQDVADLLYAKTLTKSQKKLKDSIMKILETRR